MNLIYSPRRVHNPYYSFRGKFARSGRGSSTEKSKIVDSGSICSAPDGKGSKLQYEPHLFSVRCSQTELSISGETFGRSGKGSFAERLKSVIKVLYFMQVKEKVPSFNMDLISSA